MSNKIDAGTTRSAFFPNTRKPQASETGDASDVGGLKRNSLDKAGDIQTRTSTDARVEIPDSIKDFSRIKKVADAAPPVDNSEKIARLKAQIQNGTYQVDYDGLAEKILTSEY
ncbi:MAG: flagellar biosynthesis anti-sigma factor FlgM [Bacteriovoracaceae bacterium]